MFSAAMLFLVVDSIFQHRFEFSRVHSHVIMSLCNLRKLRVVSGQGHCYVHYAVVIVTS
jgi:hypothetical protein